MFIIRSVLFSFWFDDFVFVVSNNRAIRFVLYTCFHTKMRLFNMFLGYPVGDTTTIFIVIRVLRQSNPALFKTIIYNI